MTESEALALVEQALADQRREVLPELQKIRAWFLAQKVLPSKYALECLERAIIALGGTTDAP